MRIFLCFTALVLSLEAGTAQAATERFEVSPARRQIYIGEAGKWTQWSVLGAGQQVSIDVKQATDGQHA